MSGQSPPFWRTRKSGRPDLITDRSDKPDRPDEGPADPAPDGGDLPSSEKVREEISREILRIHEESYGKGAGRTETYVGDDWVVVMLDELELLPNEEFLVEKGQHDTVIQVRTQYQAAIRANFGAAVERATGRRVIGFASTTSLEEPRFAVEIFRLAT